jgi:hypothetical protein
LKVDVPLQEFCQAQEDLERELNVGQPAELGSASDQTGGSS